MKSVTSLDPTQAIALAQAAGTDPTLWGPLLREILRACQADQGGALFVPRPSPDCRNLVASEGAFAAAGVSYFSHWINQDPWLHAARETRMFIRAGELCFGREFVPDAEVQRTAFYNDFARYCGGGQKLSLKVCDDLDQSAPTMHLSINRSFGKPLLGEGEKQYLWQLWQPLQAAMHVRWRLRHVPNFGSGAAMALDAVPYPSLVLRADASVDFMNEAAQLLMRRTSWFRVLSKRIHQVGDLDLPMLSRAAWSAPCKSPLTAAFDYGENGVRCSGTMRLVPLAPGSTYAAHWPHAQALMFIDLPADSSLEARVDRFARHHQLTARERGVLSLAVAGRTPLQIADQLGIAEGTARVHLSNLGKKTGGKGRGELIRRVMLM